MNGPSLGVGAVLGGSELITLADGTMFPLSVEGRELAVAPLGAAGGGAVLLGAMLSARDAAKAPLVLRIEGFQRAQGADTGITVYDVSRSAGLSSGGGWEPVCADDAGKSVGAMLLPGQWDKAARSYVSEGFTLACPEGALARCATAGYDPWIPELLDHFLACVRMIRDDYCGDGVSHTKSGTRIRAYDDIGIHPRGSGDGWVFEATWGPRGATCLGSGESADGAGSFPIKRWINQWNKGCIIPSCAADAFSAAFKDGEKLKNLCQPNPAAPGKCEPYQYFVPAPDP